MNLEYSINIHHYPDDKKQNNRTVMGVLYKKENGKTIPREYDYCCDGMKSAFDYGHVTIAYDQRNFHVKYYEKSKHLKEPTLCLKSFDETFDYDSGLDEENLPIKFCPFCSEEIIFELIEKKKITHRCKKVTKTYEECEDKREEEILFSKKEIKQWHSPIPSQLTKYLVV